jgi:hypothetical protein
MEQPSEGEFQQVLPKWPFENEFPLAYANQFSIYETEHEIILMFGCFFPSGFAHRSKEEIQEYLSKVEVKPLTKIVMSKAGFKALYGLLKGKMNEIGEESHGNGD